MAKVTRERVEEVWAQIDPALREIPDLTGRNRDKLRGICATFCMSYSAICRRWAQVRYNLTADEVNAGEIWEIRNKAQKPAAYREPESEATLAYRKHLSWAAMALRW